jgi:hypothetical protein
MRLPGGTLISLPPADAHHLIAALWDVSASQGAVVAIGKVQHGLAEGQRDELVVSDLEAGAIRRALERADNLTPELTRLKDAAS